MTYLAPSLSPCPLLFLSPASRFFPFYGYCSSLFVTNCYNWAVQIFTSFLSLLPWQNMILSFSERLREENVQLSHLRVLFHKKKHNIFQKLNIRSLCFIVLPLHWNIAYFHCLPSENNCQAESRIPPFPSMRIWVHLISKRVLLHPFYFSSETVGLLDF